MADSMPQPKVLVRMMAQKRGVSLDEYARTTSFGEFLGEVSAWYNGFMVPLNTVMQAFSGTGSSAEKAAAASMMEKTKVNSRYAALKQKYAGKKTTFHDLDTEQGQLGLIYGEKTTGIKRVTSRPRTGADALRSQKSARLF